MKTYAVAINGQPQGPFSEEVVAGMLNDGRITATALCWTEGMADWQPVSAFPEFGGEDAFQPPPLPEAEPAADEAKRANSVAPAEESSERAGRIVSGLVMIAGGIGASVWSHNAAVEAGGGRYVLFSGAIVWGIYRVIKALVGW